MLPLFPAFKKLELDDEEPIGKLTRDLDPLVSDFCFSTLWLYNLEENTRWSVLRGNLVLAVPNGFNPHGPYLTLCGKRIEERTVDELLRYATEHGHLPVLHRVPEVVATQLGPRYSVCEEPNHFDYVYSIEALCARFGHQYATLRKNLSRFDRLCAGHHTFELDLKDRRVVADMERLIETWLERKSANQHVRHYVHALERLLQDGGGEFLVFGVELHDRLIGYGIGRPVGHWLMYYFAVTDAQYEGLTRHLLCTLALRGKELGCTYLNAEEDGGDLGLRQFKVSCVPAFMVRKYCVSAAGLQI